MKNKKDLFDLLKMLNNKNEEISEFLNEHYALGDEIDFVWDLIIDSFNIPPDTTIEMFKKYGSLEKAINDKKFYNRDYAFDILSSFASGNISKKVAIKKLQALTNN